MNDSSQNRTLFYFVLLTLCLDLVLAAFEISFGLGREAILLTTCILGLSIAQMTFCLVLLMRNFTLWMQLIAGFIVAMLFGLTPTIGLGGVPFDRVLVIQLTTLSFGIAPVAIYRVVFVGLRVQFSLSILFGLMSLMTVVCAIAIQLDLDWMWFWRCLYIFLSSAIPIPVAGFMLVGRRTATIPRYAMIMSLLVVIGAITALSAGGLINDISLVGQISGFMSLYLLIGGVVLVREIKARTSSPQTEVPQPIEDPIAPEQ